ncbi:acetyl-CoA carboxylase biotin carboxylase subunit [Kineococcus sp. G2]|uniref:acetyl-CoA carboxylase biotin carboxylase subunit n=1 Tax=Kineococcus sp. G2 TaxID=3127484 RepID=UPI003FA599D3
MRSLLVANRGEIARRVITTAERLGIRTIAVHSDVDADLPFVREADQAVALGGTSAAETYRDVDKVLAAVRASGAQAVHPGYGLLSENADFAQAVLDAGVTWVGPSPEVIRAMGDKIAARNLMAAAGVPVAAGTRTPVTGADALAQAQRIGLPLMVKAAAGGGGMGMAVVRDVEQLVSTVERVTQFAERSFGDGSVLLERFVERARHVEVQILGLADGRVLALGERECSVQRRHQKLVEETPSPAVDEDLRARMLHAAQLAGQSVDYRGAGTVEFLLDAATGDFSFLEMNTRLQVEHPITELTCGLDLVEAQLRIAAGLDVAFDAAAAPGGHAIELRINAEDPQRFLPGPGTISVWEEPVEQGVRVDAGYRAGNRVTPAYDSLMAKVIVHAEDRAGALELARRAVKAFRIVGPKHNLDFFSELLDEDEFVSGAYDTGVIERMRAR